MDDSTQDQNQHQNEGGVIPPLPVYTPRHANPARTRNLNIPEVRPDETLGTPLPQHRAPSAPVAQPQTADEPAAPSDPAETVMMAPKTAGATAPDATAPDTTAPDTTAPDTTAPNLRVRAAIPFRPQAETPEDGEDAPKKTRSPKKRAAITIAGVAAVAAVGYGAGTIAFSNVLYPGTEVAGVDISLMDKDTAAAKINQEFSNYKLTVEGNDFSWSYKPNKDEVLVDADTTVQNILAANEAPAWPVKLAESISGKNKDERKNQVVLSGTFSTDAFLADLDAKVDEYNKGRSGAFDAPSAYDAQKGAFTIERAKQNVKINKEGLNQKAVAAIKALDSKLEMNEDDFDKLRVGFSDDQLKAACDEANKLIGTSVTLKMQGQEVGKLDGAQMAKWIVFDDNLQPELDTKQMTEWAYGLDDNLDTAGTERTYTRPDGKKVTVSGGTYGWVVNSDELVRKIQDAVANKQTGDIEVPLKSKGDKFTKRGEPDWSAYIDIDLAEQHARLYDANGTLTWESGIISGNPNKGNETPTGVYRMNAIGKNFTLVGKKDPETGKPEYETPVAYWMPFVGSAIGLHDASWQTAGNFNDPEAYKRVGSHGCINLPPDKAADLYSKISEGIAVVVHN